MMTSMEDTTIMAYVWMDQSRRYFVSSASSLQPGNPIIHKRWTEVGDEDNPGQRLAKKKQIKIPIPKASEVYFEACGKIDQHNKIREECGIDKRFNTNNWDIRVNFSILSMIFTDAWLLFKASRAGEVNSTPQLFLNNWQRI